MRTSTALIKGLARLDKGWCQEASARDKAGNEVEERSRKACVFCATGVLYRVTPNTPAGIVTAEEAIDLLELAIPLASMRSKGYREEVSIGSHPAIVYNDAPTRTFKQIRSWFAKAIDLAKAREAGK